MEENHQPLGRILGPVEEPAPSQPRALTPVEEPVPSQPRALTPVGEPAPPVKKRRRQQEGNGRRKLIIRIILLIVLLALIILGIRDFTHEDPRELLVNPPAAVQPAADNGQPAPTAP